jgi:malonyl-CoA/methylmalonyl-CoA synthetase
VSFLDALSENIQRFPEKVALDFLGPPARQITYAELGDLVARSSTYLRNLGVSPGDRVALQLPKSLEFILLNLGTLSTGAISLPLNPAYPADELRYFLRDSGARTFFTSTRAGTAPHPTPAELPDLRDVVTVSSAGRADYLAVGEKALKSKFRPSAARKEDTATLVYTSGTTGRAKGAEITHGNITAMLNALHIAWDWRPDDVLLHVLPIFHIHGLFVALYGALYAGATTLLMDSFDAAQTLDILAQKRCTVFMGVPTIHRRLLDTAADERIDLSHMRLMTSGSDRLPDDVFAAYQQTFGYTLVERYGMTETGINCSNPVHGERRIGSVGPPLPSVEIRVVLPDGDQPAESEQVGQVQVRGPSIFKGYWRQPQQTADAFTEDGWFRTGDLGTLAPDGYLTLSGRSKDLIISGGLNVYPPEVERVLLQHPSVQAAAVIGCPDPDWGERVIALVIPAAGNAVSEDELIAFCRERLAPYKTPKSVVFAPDLPRNAMGKVQKAILRREHCPGGS